VNVRLHARSDAVVEAHYRGDQAVALIFDFRAIDEPIDLGD